MNIGSRRATTLLELATTIADESGTSIEALGYSVDGTATRVGDLRACIADCTLAQTELALIGIVLTAAARRRRA